MTESAVGAGETPDLNTYEGISKYYDTLMTSGYYDYGEFAAALHKSLGEGGEIRRKVLELGVGTGLLSEELLGIEASYEITGIDNTESMISQAKTRLGERISYHMQDITELQLNDQFDAAFSVGGCWYFIDHGSSQELEWCSHIDDPNLSKRGVERVVSHLNSGAILCFALQGAHTNYSRELEEGLVYSQSIAKEPGGFVKSYRFERAGELVASQDYRYLTRSLNDCHSQFEELGCRPLGLDEARKFFRYQKL